MLGRKDYTQEELDHATTAVKEQPATYKALAKRAETRSLSSVPTRPS